MNPLSTDDRYEVHVQVFKLGPRQASPVPVAVTRPNGPVEFIVYPNLSRAQADAIVGASWRSIKTT